MEDKKEKENKNEENLKKASVEGAAAEIVQRYGSANKEHLVAYSGIDNEINKKLKKSLDSISKEKINPDYEFQNTQQQAGFAAEVKDTARTNAENIIASKKERKVRTDDIDRVNDELYDHMTVDENGNIIDGTGSQMKFIGASQKDPAGIGAPERALNKLKSKKFEKYLDADAKIDVPSDYYERMQQIADEQIDKLEKQVELAQKNGKTDIVNQKKAQIAKLKKIKRNLRKSKVSSKEAVFARNHPKLSTAKDIAKISHRAGVEAAKMGAAVGGTVSMVQNIVALYKGDIKPEQAVKNVAKDTACSTVVAYGTGFAGSALKGVMQNAGNATVRSLSKTNLPATIVTCSVTVGKSLKRYFNGEINGVECFQELGEQGTGMISSAMFATIGQTVIPIPVVGAMIGSMVGYTISSASYGLLLESLKEKELARKRRIAIEKECEEHIKLIRAYRKELEENIIQYLGKHMVLFNNAFEELKSSLNIGDVDGVIANANKVTSALGKEVQFNNFDEFDDLMNSDKTLRM